MSRSPEFKIWTGIRSRCNTRVSNAGTRHYADRGIGICPEWATSFSRFYRDMGPRPSSDHSIERIDNNANYEPGNCRWATYSEQMNNRRVTVRVPYKNGELPLADACREARVNRHTVWARLKRGQSAEAALQPPKPPASLTVRGVTRTIPEWGRRLGLTRTSAYRLHREGRMLARLLAAER